MKSDIQVKIVLPTGGVNKEIRSWSQLMKKTPWHFNPGSVSPPQNTKQRSR